MAGRQKKDTGNSNLIPFKKGYDKRRNNGGRPKAADTFSDTMRRMLNSNKIEVTWTEDGEKKTRQVKVEDGKNFNYALAATLVMEGLAGNLRAIKEIINRVEGRPAQQLTVQAGDRPWDPVEGMTPEERWKFIEAGYETLRKHRAAV